jgi:hypothetical protein
LDHFLRAEVVSVAGFQKSDPSDPSDPSFFTDIEKSTLFFSKIAAKTTAMELQQWLQR